MNGNCWFPGCMRAADFVTYVPPDYADTLPSDIIAYIHTCGEHLADAMVERERRKGAFVCDGCMQRVTAADIEVWADYEHVLCGRCTR